MIHMVAATFARDQHSVVDNYVKLLNLQVYCLMYLERPQIMSVGDRYSWYY